MTSGNEPPGAFVGFSQGQTATTVDGFLIGAENPPRVANLTGGGDAATAGGLAAGAGRGVAGVAG
jgi:hypothetical protein